MDYTPSDQTHIAIMALLEPKRRFVLSPDGVCNSRLLMVLLVGTDSGEYKLSPMFDPESAPKPERPAGSYPAPFKPQHQDD